MFQQCFDEAEKHYDETVGQEKKLTIDDCINDSEVSFTCFSNVLMKQRSTIIKLLGERKS